MAKHWIAGAVGKGGQLHKALGVPADQKIPPAQLQAALHSHNKRVAAEARLAVTLKSMHHIKK